MSALWLWFLTIVYLPCVALSNPEEGGVVWRDLGGSITIQCRLGAGFQKQNQLSVKRGLHKHDVFSTNTNLRDNITAKEVKSRLEVLGAFPSLDLVISNLTMEDTGPYWCMYTRTEKTMDTKEGNGAVLLVVKGDKQCAAENTNQQCAAGNTHLFLGALVSCAVLLVIIIIVFLLWIVNKTITRTTKRTITNDVYEDMRGTHRH